jgi:hypothetical protein
MASEPLPTPTLQTRRNAVDRTLSVRIVIAAFVALLILFGWLHMIQALEIASTGRDIQDKMEELKEVRRENDYLRWRIAQELSVAEMSDRARHLGYRQQEPVYLPLP